MFFKQELVQKWRNMHVDEVILQAFREVPREKFLRPEQRELAYLDQPLPTLRGQSISQPTTIIMMLQALEIKEGEKVLEVGAGVGYQAALLGKIVEERGKVISLEVIPELVQAAKKNMEELKIKNVQIIEADGGEGYPPEAPYDRIIITAACLSIPQPLIGQLKERGIIIAPVGDLQSQTMVKGIKTKGKLELEFLGSFVFVPLRGKYGFEER